MSAMQPTVLTSGRPLASNPRPWGAPFPALREIAHAEHINQHP